MFYHEKLPFPKTPLPFAVKPEITKPELAPIEIRDFVYRKLIELSPATASKEIIIGPKGLRERGILDFGNYGSLPKKHIDRDKLAKQLRHSINANFPDFVREHLLGITRVPGFWIDKTGKARLWLETDSLTPMLLIPYRDKFGMIQACQIRLMGDLYEVKKDSLRYLWLSTPKKNNGLSCGSPLHYELGFDDLGKRPIIITEGALKADTVKAIEPNFRIIAIAGVNLSHAEIIAATRFCPVILAFDIDSKTNRYIARAIANLIFLRFNDSERYCYEFDLKLMCWDNGHKGIDDALLQNSKIFEISVFKWFEQLSSSCKNEVTKVLHSIKFESL